MPHLSLDCLTLPDVKPVELIAVAAQADFQSFSLWVQPPAMFPPMLATSTQHRDIAKAMADYAIPLGTLEVFNLNGNEPIAAYESVIAFGAQLGARTATAIDFGEPREDIPQRLAAFQALCARYGIATLVEPIAMGNVRTPLEGHRLIQSAGVDAKLVIDCLHLVRTGCTAETLKAIPADLIGYVQLCDGPLTIAPDAIGTEAMANRLYPGEGEFPLRDILAAVSSDVVVGIEVPNLDRQQRGVTPLDRAREAIAAAKQILSHVQR
jgi:sugar phosphate isomerase/epimerase